MPWLVERETQPHQTPPDDRMRRLCRRAPEQNLIGDQKWEERLAGATFESALSMLYLFMLKVPALQRSEVVPEQLA
jgi:hypothetical protein